MDMKRTYYKLFAVLLSTIISTSVAAQIDHWEKLVGEDDTWQYRIGNSEPSSNWMNPSFNASTWSTGVGGIGYGDGDDSTVISNCASLYMRRSFNVSQLDSIEAFILHADYDDGFVAYLNGTEIARANVDTLTPPFNYSPPVWREAKMYQGGEPVTFVLDKAQWQSLVSNGANVLAVHTLNNNGANSSDMSARYWLHCGVITTNQIHSTPAAWFDFDGFESPVAVLRINTFEEAIPDAPSIRGRMEIVWTDTTVSHASYGAPSNLVTNIEIEKRGRWSQFVYPKNGYAIETKDFHWEDTDVSPLLMPLEEDWTLHGPYGDRSFMRNVLAMRLANKQRNYASRTRFVELFINGDYEGLYVMMEKIKRGEDRVDIAKLKPDEISGDDVTGGYIFKTDWEPVDWRSSFNMLSDTTKIPYTYAYPKRKNIAQQQESYIQNYVDDWEHSMQNTTVTYNGKYWHQYMDLASFVDFFLMMELTKDIDAYRASTYYHKKKDSNGGKIYAGPVWDFNFAFGLVDYCQGYLPNGYMFSGNWCSGTNPAWWEDLVYTPLFSDAVNCRWKELRTSVWHKDSIKTFIADNEALLMSAATRNHSRWPLMGSNPSAVKYIAATFSGDVAIMEDWLMDRIDWLDSNMIGADCLLGTESVNAIATNLTVYPNPSSGICTVETKLNLTSVNVRSNTGQLVAVIHFDATYSAEKRILDLSELATGMYALEFISSEVSFVKKIAIVR